MNEKKFVLLDLERSMPSGIAHYWKQNKHGYTVDPSDAGLFDEVEAHKIADDDHDNLTLPISADVVAK